MDSIEREVAGIVSLLNHIAFPIWRN